ncbi:GPI-anchored protein LLG1-like [Primulina eburnea]|uniref:GPI-anchored protein LLG1-like n=1 Tax=Primulina eburnea TaxID=1245227 RepID=UPI003C6CB775
MGSKESLRFCIFFIVAGLAFASSSYISNEVVEPHGSMGRSLLQQKTTCSVDFEKMNYSVITSQCKGPNYTPERCCMPLKVLLCPVKDQVNDLKSNCADTFFSYVNLYGKYPPGLFASLCKEGEQGLDCQSVEQPPPPKSEGFRGGVRPALLMMIIAGLVMVILS